MPVLVLFAETDFVARTFLVAGACFGLLPLLFSFNWACFDLRGEGDESSIGGQTAARLRLQRRTARRQV